MVQHHRLPASWLTQYLYTCPLDLEERGVASPTVRLPEVMSDWVGGWDGVAVGPQGSEVRHLKGEDLRALITRPQLVLLGHDEGRLLHAEPEEFKTPPRPQATQCLEPGTPPPEEDFAPVIPPDEELWHMYETERHRTQDSASAIAPLASAYECSPDQIRAKVVLTSCLPLRMWVWCLPPLGLTQNMRFHADYACFSAEEVRPPLPPPSRPPPGLDLFTSDSGSGSTSQLVAPVVPSRSIGGSRPLPTSTSRGLAASLFPQGGVGTDRNTSGQGFRTKPVLRSERPLGSDLPTASADRIIHAIDGIRRAQEAEKTGTKGTLASIQEAEKLDVFLARGCGELTVELCKGVYGKELFHAIKRAGHHAKHALILMRWPVHITNRLALAIAGLWCGGKNPTPS